jgi:excisionase family DNA binding protein
VNVRQVAKEYNVAPARIYKWVKSGQLGFLRLPGGDYRFRRWHLDEFDRRRQGNLSSDQTSDSAGTTESAEEAGTSTGPTTVLARVSRDMFQLGQAMRVEADRKRQQREANREGRRQAHAVRAVERALKSRGTDLP